MVERIIEFSARNRFLVLLLTGVALARRAVVASATSRSTPSPTSPTRR